MSNSITIGLINIKRHESGLYSLNDLHNASGRESRHNPNEFLKLKQTQEMIAEISSGGITLLEIVTKVHGGKLRGTYVCRELVYQYATWVSSKFFLAVIRTFDAVLNATSPEELAAIKDQLSWSMGELVQIEARHPKDKRTLSAIFGLACSQIYPYFKHLVGIGELEQVRVPQPDKIIYRPTRQTRSVVGHNGDTLLFDAVAVKKLIPLQTSWIAGDSL